MKVYKIDQNNNGSRLDRWLKRTVCNVPQSLVEKSIRRGKIKVNKKREKSSYKLQKGDEIYIRDFNYKEHLNQKIKKKYSPTKKDLKFSSDLFIENNENFVVINKPAGISVQSGTKSKRNILDILRETKEFEGFTPFTVHRIDKETTGVLIVAKNRKFAQLFTSLFRIRKIHKTYLGIVLGEPDKKKGIYEDELLYYEGDKKTTAKAVTRYSVIDSNNSYSLLKLNPVTGRKHQLRKQLLLHGHPIFGDVKYNIIKKNLLRKNSSLMLHAYKVNFSISDKKYTFIADPPLNFINLLKEKYLKTF
tara:strand:+ start:1022 stop:1933 length:912 start_codon:yes stop_codon:yes gene_type:complete